VEWVAWDIINSHKWIVEWCTWEIALRLESGTGASVWDVINFQTESECGMGVPVTVLTLRLETGRVHQYIGIPCY
jgi:hypothetical protein